ncbi:MAG: hypothetical protein GY719_38200 [bacterium]|nr:hypothetical protein [bacterium]
MSQGPLEVAYEVIEVLEGLQVPYHVGGSFASSLHGVPRQTHDLDLVVDLRPEKVPRLVDRLSGRFYIDADMIYGAIRREGSTNLLHLETGFKIDLFIRQPGPFDSSEFRRHGPQRLSEDSSREVMVKSAEDTLLRKLQWYREGRMVSDRQWTDILGIVQTQGDRLDEDYLHYWAGELELDELLERALASRAENPPDGR